MDKTLEQRITELEDELRDRDRRINELKTEVDEGRNLIERMREQVEDSDQLIDSWIEAFGMQQGDNGNWGYGSWVDTCVSFRDKYRALLKEWNKFVDQYNAAVASRRRNVGRPLGAAMLNAILS